jgi:hypothetical protein
MRWVSTGESTLTDIQLTDQLILILLILNGHESYYSLDFEIYCEENNIITLCRSSYSSHLI